ncbi:MAG: 3'-5' exonuclease, partial [Salinarchaeum sp.]
MSKFYDPDRERVMVDIETLGIEPGAAVLSIGAVTFDTDGIGAQFHRSIDLQSCQDAGLAIDAETLQWWLDQDGDARAVLTGGDPLADVLAAFTEFVPEDAEVWANGPQFDCEHLEAAYAAVDMDAPWTFRDERDVRTVRALPVAPDVEQDGTEHDALDDAVYQARIVGEALNRLESGEWGGGDGV